MTAPMSNGRPLAEALGTPVVTSEGGILTGDTAKDSGSASPDQAQRHSLDAVGVGIARFLAAFRESFGTDAEHELAEPVLCRECGEYPAAWMGCCFTCNADRRLSC